MINFASNPIFSASLSSKIKISSLSNSMQAISIEVRPKALAIPATMKRGYFNNSYWCFIPVARQ
jgi:hypothetical protein